MERGKKCLLGLHFINSTRKHTNNEVYALLFQVPGYALYNHFSHSLPLNTTLYPVKGQVLTGIRIPFINNCLLYVSLYLY